MFVPLVLLALQGQVQTPDRVRFSEIFPHPTGDNGYEKYVQAAEILTAKGDLEGLEAAIAAAWQNGDYLAALTKEYEAYPAIGPLIAQGDQLPVSLPDRTYKLNSDPPEVNSLRLIGRVQTHLVYVEYANGKSEAATTRLLNTLLFAHNISQGPAVMRMTGIAIESQCLRELERHLDQITLDSAKSLAAFADAELKEKPASLNCLDTEEQITERGLYDPSFNLSTLLGTTDAAKRWPSLSNDQKGAVVDAVVTRLKTLYGQARTVLSGPAQDWISGEPAATPDIHQDSAAPDVILSSLRDEDFLRGLISAEALKRVQFQLLSLDAKAIQYRWQHASPPKSLSDIASGDEARDRVFGGDFIYKLFGQTFTLKDSGGKHQDPITLGMIVHRPAQTKQPSENP